MKQPPKPMKKPEDAAAAYKARQSLARTSKVEAGDDMVKKKCGGTIKKMKQGGKVGKKAC